MTATQVTKPLDPKVVHRLLTTDGTFATCLHIIVLTIYGPDAYDYDPLALMLALEDDFNAQITDSNENKLKAILLAATTSAFHQNPEAFRGVCETFADGDPGIELLDTLTLPEAGWGLYEVEVNVGDEPLSTSVEAILASLIAAEGQDLETTEESEVFSQVWGYLTEQHQLLVGQLIELGVPITGLPPLRQPGRLEEAATDSIAAL